MLLVEAHLEFPDFPRLHRTAEDAPYHRDGNGARPALDGPKPNFVLPRGSVDDKLRRRNVALHADARADCIYSERVHDALPAIHGARHGREDVLGAETLFV